MPSNIRPETQTPNVGETNSSAMNAISAGASPASVGVEVAPESPIEPDLTLAERWERQQAEEAAIEAEQERAQRELARAQRVEYIEPIPTPEVIQLARALGLEINRWTDDLILQFEMLQRAQTVPVVTGVLLIQGLDSIKQCEKAYKVLGELGEDAQISPDVRVAACKAIAETVKAHCAMSAHALSLAKETRAKKTEDQPRVLPPNFNVQINCPPGAPPGNVRVAPAINGTPEISASVS